MKTISAWAFLCVVAGVAFGGCATRPAEDLSRTVSKKPVTFSSFDVGTTGQSTNVGPFRFVDADLKQILNYYAYLSGRVVIRSAQLPPARVTLESAASMTRTETLQALDTALSQNGIAMVLMGGRFVKAVPAGAATTEGGPVIDLPRELIPDSGSFMIYPVQLKHRNVSDLIPGLQPFAKLPNSIVGLQEGNLLILRDYATNIRRMLEVIERLDTPPLAAPKSAATK